MDMPAAERSTCAICGTALEETTAGELGCLPCLLRAGLTSDDSAQDRHRAEHFGAYVIERDEKGNWIELGRGANGVTYRAIDTALQRKVALKIIVSESATQSAGERERFMRGARAAATLRHENVATIYHFGVQEESGEYFYAMELVEGETLEERVRRTGPLDARSTIELARQVVSALGAAEKCGVIHRDLKPGNIMLVRQDDEAMQVKVIDFGLAKVVGEVADPMTLTHGGFVGTPAFASPEQFAHKSLDVRSDIYSLGVTLWFALTGQTPSAGRSVEEIRAAQSSGALPWEKLKAVQVPKTLMSILRAMLALEPASRPSVREVTTQLQSNAKGNLRRNFALGAATILISAVAISFWSTKSSPGLTNSAEKVLAVIPFTNLSSDPNAGFFTYGIRAGITSRLSRLSDLKLVTSEVLKDQDDSPESVKELAATLGVPLVLQGSLEKSGDQFRIKVRLTRAKDDVDLWTETYERKYSSIAEVEREVARRTADSLGLKLTEPEERAIAASATANPRAYEAYLKGRDVWMQRTVDSFLQALQYFDEAIALDPKYVNAYVGRADAYQFLAVSDFAYETRQKYMAQAKEACARALELDPQSGPAHASRGLIAMNCDWDWPLAEQEMKRAIDLDPNNPLIHDWYAELERTVGREDLSLYHIRLACELDPLSPLLNSDAGKLLYAARHYEAAVSRLQKAIRMNPSFHQPHMWLGYTFVEMGKCDDALREFGGLTQKGANAFQASLQAFAYGRAGRKKEAKAKSEVVKRSISNGFGESQLAEFFACIAVGDEDGALRAMEEDFARHGVTTIAAKSMPYFDDLRSDPRFADLLRRMHLAP